MKRSGEDDDVVPVVANKKAREESCEVTASSTVFGVNFLLSAILYHIPVLELVKCSHVSKAWAQTLLSDDLWLKKYITAAQLDANIIPFGKYPPGYFRRIYMDRFGRFDQFFILLDNFNNTHNIKHMHQFQRIVQTSYLSHFLRKDPVTKFVISSPADDLIRINNFVYQKSFYPRINGPSGSATMNASATLYSQVSLESVRIGAEIAHGRTPTENWTSIKIVALFKGVDSAEHLCKAVNPADLKPGMLGVDVVSTMHGNFVQPQVAACKRLVDIMGITMTPLEILSFLLDVFFGIRDNHIICIRDFMLLFGGAYSLKSLLTNYKDIISKDQQRTVAWRVPANTVEGSADAKSFWKEAGISATRSFYAQLSHLVSGEIRKHEALNDARILNEPPVRDSVLRLITHTRIEQWSTFCGKMQPELWGHPPSDNWGLCNYTQCQFVISLAMLEPMRFRTTLMHSEQANEPKVSSDLHQGDFHIAMFKENFTLVSTNISFIEKISPHIPITVFDFVMYTMIISNIYRDFVIKPNSKNPNSDISLHLRNQPHREEYFNSEKQQVAAIIQELRWDGLQAPE